MVNGNTIAITNWQSIAARMSNDTDLMDMLVDSAKATEVVARTPVEVYLKLKNDIGNEGLDILPEPNSNQENKTDGLGFHIGDNQRAIRDADPFKHWDKYFHKGPNEEQREGSVYVDMVKSTKIGKHYDDSAEVLKAWNAQDAKPEVLQKTVQIDGDVYECSKITGKQRDNMRLMLNGRVMRMASSLRRVVGIHRQIKEIKERLSEYCNVSFVYNDMSNPSSGLAKVTKPILLRELNSNKASEDYGQLTGFVEAYAPSVFILLDVDKAVQAQDSKYTALKDSRKARAGKAPKAGASTKEKDKAVIEGRASANNLLTIMGNLRIFAEDEDSKRRAYDRLSAMKTDDRSELIASILYWRDWSAEFDTPANRAIMQEYTGTKAEKAKAELEAKLAHEASVKEAEAQPTQNERSEEAERQAALKAASDAAVKAKVEATPGRRSSRRAAS